MLSNMKNIIIAILIYFLIIPCGYCDDGLIWNYKNESYIKSIQNCDAATIKKRQRDLDNAIRKGLDIDLIPLSLDDCLKIALCNNATMQLRKSQSAEKKWLYKNSLADMIPDIYGRYLLQDVRGEFLVGDLLLRRINTNPVYMGITVDYPIGNGSIFFNMASKKKQLLAAEHIAAFSKEEVILKTTLNYYSLLETKLNIEVLISNLKDRAEQLKLMEARKKIGVGSGYEVLRAESELAQAKSALITEINALRLKQANLTYVMGIDIAATVYPMENSVEVRKLNENNCGVEELYQIALKLREDVLAKEAEIKSLIIEKNKNYTDFAPRLELAYEYGRAGTLQTGSLRPNHTYSLSVIWPVGSKLGVATITKKNADLEKIKSAKLELRILQGDIKQAILNSYYNSKTALEKIEANKKEVTTAEESLRYSVVGFSIGTNNLLDIISSQTQKVSAQQTLIRSIIEYNKAQTQLLFDTGTITAEGVLKNYKTPSNLKNAKID